MSRNNHIVKILESIGCLTREFNANYDYPFVGYSLNKPQIEVLFILSQFQPLAIKQLSEKLNITSGGVTQIINSLEKLSLVKKSGNFKDKRIRQVSLSHEAELEIKTFQEKYIDFVGSPFSKLTVSELVQLDALLEKVKKGKND